MANDCQTNQIWIEILIADPKFSIFPKGDWNFQILIHSMGFHSNLWAELLKKLKATGCYIIFFADLNFVLLWGKLSTVLFKLLPIKNACGFIFNNNFFLYNKFAGLLSDNGYYWVVCLVVLMLVGGEMEALRI